MLSVLTMAYHGKSVEDIRVIGPGESWRQEVFATYVQRMPQRRGVEIRFAQEQTIHWLVWLAWEMGRHSQSEFYIERLKVDSDGTSDHVFRLLRRLILATLIFAVIVGLPFGVVVALIVGLAALWADLWTGTWANLWIGLGTHSWVNHQADHRADCWVSEL